MASWTVPVKRGRRSGNSGRRVGCRPCRSKSGVTDEATCVPLTDKTTFMTDVVFAVYDVAA